MEFVQAGIVAIASELDLELHLVALPYSRRIAFYEVDIPRGILARVCSSRPGARIAGQPSVMMNGLMLRDRHSLAVLVAVVWLVVGPIAMSVGGCAAMGGMCEAPCGAGAYAFLASPEQPILPLVVVLSPSTREHVPSVALRVAELPPRPSPLSA